jgi:hypothetical protein
VKKIILSILLVSGSAWGCWGIYFYYGNARSYNPKYHILAILQTGPEKEALRTNFLAELLHLSVDRPVNLYQFPLNRGEEALLSFPLIKKASLKRIPPGTLYIDYEIRKPIVFLGDFTNTAMDEEGYLLPFKPFYSPKNLPELVLGLHGETSRWGEKVQSEEVQLAFDIRKVFSQVLEGMALLKIDVSRMKAPSLGERQVIVVLEKLLSSDSESGRSSKWTLILHPDTYRDGLMRFKAFTKARDAEKVDSWVLDLRLENLGFLNGGL